MTHRTKLDNKKATVDPPTSQRQAFEQPGAISIKGIYIFNSLDNREGVNYIPCINRRHPCCPDFQRK